jgi:hypothetical protein
MMTSDATKTLPLLGWKGKFGIEKYAIHRAMGAKT